MKRDERITRGESEQIQTAFLQSKALSDFRARVQESNHCLRELSCEAIVISREEICVRLTTGEEQLVGELQTTYKEVDTNSFFLPIITLKIHSVLQYFIYEEKQMSWF